MQFLARLSVTTAAGGSPSGIPCFGDGAAGGQTATWLCLHHVAVSRTLLLPVHTEIRKLGVLPPGLSYDAECLVVSVRPSSYKF